MHSVAPVLDVPKVPAINEMPSFLKRRLARRYEDRGEPVPDYLRDDVSAPIDEVLDQVVSKAEDEYKQASQSVSVPVAPPKPIQPEQPAP